MTTDACNTGLGATLWQKEGEVFRPLAFASRFLTDCERKSAIKELKLLGALWGLEHFRYYVYGKKVNLLTDHQALQPLLKRNRTHKQYGARLTRWLDRLSHFDVNLQYTAGKNTPLTDYLSRHPIANTAENETETERRETEAEEEFVINQIHGLFNFVQTNGSIKEFAERIRPRNKTDHSQLSTRKHERGEKINLLEASTPSNSLHLKLPDKFSKTNCLPQDITMDRVNGIDMHFIHKKRGHSPETHRLWIERKQILKPEKTRIIGRGKDNERLHEYRPTQQGRQRTVELNIQYKSTTGSSIIARHSGQHHLDNTNKIIMNPSATTIFRT